MPECIEAWNGESTDFLVMTHLSDNTFTERVWFNSRPDVSLEQIRMKLDAATGGHQYNSQSGWNGETTVVCGWDNTDLTSYRDGVFEETVVTATGMPLGCNRMDIGALHNNARHMAGWIRRVKYWSTRLSDTQLQEESST